MCARTAVRAALRGAAAARIAGIVRGADRGSAQGSRCCADRPWRRAQLRDAAASCGIGRKAARCVRRIADRAARPAALRFLRCRQGAPTQAARVCQELRRRGRRSRALTTDKGAWLVFRGTEAAPRPPTCFRDREPGSRIPAHRRSGCAGVRAAPNSYGPCGRSYCCSAMRSLPARCSGSAPGAAPWAIAFTRPGPSRSNPPTGYEAALRRAKVIADFAGVAPSSARASRPLAAQGGGTP
jgi:hypothetical protein